MLQSIRRALLRLPQRTRGAVLFTPGALASLAFLVYIGFPFWAVFKFCGSILGLAALAYITLVGAILLFGERGSF